MRGVRTGGRLDEPGEETGGPGVGEAFDACTAGEVVAGAAEPTEGHCDGDVTAVEVSDDRAEAGLVGPENEGRGELHNLNAGGGAVPGGTRVEKLKEVGARRGGRTRPGRLKRIGAAQPDLVAFSGRCARAKVEINRIKVTARTRGRISTEGRHFLKLITTLFS